MPFSALPKELQDIENNFPDDDQYLHIPVFGQIYRWANKATKTWFAFSYRCTEWWAKWRKYPKVLFAIGENEWWRIETEMSEHLLDIGKVLWFPRSNDCYLSRVQYYKRWHVSLQWPLMVTGHFYFKKEYVPKWGKPRPDLKGKLLFFYWNHFDADLVYWMVTSMFLGTRWK